MRRSILSALALLAFGMAAPASAGPRPPVYVHTVLEAGSALQPGEYLWDTEGAPPGRIQIVVDLDAERLYVYRGGVEIGRTIIIYGTDRKPTPTGAFTILEKDADHISNIYGAPMPHMLRLTWSGIAIHGSGEDVDSRYATHGCIGVPDEFARILFGSARKGDTVLVTRGWMRHVYGAGA